MSVEAITWALKQPIKMSSAKFVLVVLANQANAETGIAYPSVAYLAESTGQDRKTVIRNLARLCEMGLIEDSGDRKGVTAQIVSYRLKLAPDLFDEEKRNSSKKGTVPKSPRNSTTFALKDSQKRYTEPLEPLGTIIKRNRGARLPDDWLPSQELKAEALAAHPDVDLDAATTEFRRFWAAEPDPRGRKLDWALVWQNRIAQLAKPRAGKRAEPTHASHVPYKSTAKARGDPDAPMPAAAAALAKKLGIRPANSP